MQLRGYQPQPNAAGIIWKKPRNAWKGSVRGQQPPSAVIPARPIAHYGCGTLGGRLI